MSYALNTLGAAAVLGLTATAAMAEDLKNNPTVIAYCSERAEGRGWAVQSATRRADGKVVVTCSFQDPAVGGLPTGGSGALIGLLVLGIAFGGGNTTTTTGTN